MRKTPFHSIFCPQATCYDPLLAKLCAYGRQVKLALPLLLAAALLPSCARREALSLTQRVMFTASGSYDASADSRTRLGKGIRRVHWTAKPPLPATEVTVDYESDARPLGWIMTINKPQFDAKTLAGATAKAVQTPQGPAVLVETGELRDILILTGPNTMRLLSRGYAAKQAPELLPAFAP